MHASQKVRKCKSGSHNNSLRRLVSGTNRSPAHMAHCKGSIRVLLAEGLWVTRLLVASATRTTVKPVHVCGHVVPVGDNHGHATLHSLAELLHASLVLEEGLLAMSIKRLLAEIFGHCVARTKAILRLFDFLTILVVVLVHTVKLTTLLSELSDNSEWLVCVDGVIGSRSVKLLVAKHVRIQVATIAVCGANVTLSFLLGSTLLVLIADGLRLLGLHGVQSQLHGMHIGFPHVQLCTANASPPVPMLCIGSFWFGTHSGL